MKWVENKAHPMGMRIFEIFVAHRGVKPLGYGEEKQA